MDTSYTGVLMETENYLILNFEMEFMGVNKIDGSLEYFEHALPEVPISTVGSFPFVCVIGVIQFELDIAPRLILATEAKLIGDYYQRGQMYHIDKVAAVKISPGGCLKELARTVQDMNIPTLKDENDVITDNHKLEMKLLEELYWLFQEPGTFYFGVDCDISNTIQRKLSLDKSHEDSLPIWKIFDRKYFWNFHMLKSFMSFTENYNSLQNIICPIIRGYVGTQVLHYQIAQPFSSDSTRKASKDARMILISKQSFLRAGTRLRSRGVDDRGHVSNFVETEQMLIYVDSVQSFVIIRGSIPLYWQQPVSWKYKPPFVLYNDAKSNTNTFNLHMSSIVRDYGRVVCVNLVDNAGREKVLRDAYYESIVNTAVDNVSFYDFDFHAFCKKGKYENVKLVLVKALKEEISSIKFHWRSSDNYVLSMQDGVFRVNCVDCLDRTNVVQAEISKTVLLEQLLNYGLHSDHITSDSTIQLKLNEIWASNGDNISLAYAGTAALKSDFTRTGERNIIGVMSDGYKSINRYYNNLTRDAYRQVVIDIMHGKVKSSINALEQWKVKLEDNVQTSHSAARSLSVLYDDSDTNVLKMKNKVQSVVINNFLENSSQFVKLWLTFIYDETQKKPCKDVCAIVLSRVSLIFCMLEGDHVDNYFSVPLCDLLCMEIVHEENQIYFTFAISFEDAVVKQSFYIRKDVMSTLPYLENMGNLITSFSNENMNIAFRVQNIVKRKEDLIDFEETSYMQQILTDKKLISLKEVSIESTYTDDDSDSSSDSSTDTCLSSCAIASLDIQPEKGERAADTKPPRPPKPVASQYRLESDSISQNTSNPGSKLRSGIRNIKNWIMTSSGVSQPTSEVKEPIIRYGKNLKNKIVVL